MSQSYEVMVSAENADFRRRVKWFLHKAAIAVMAESGDTAGHAERVEYAKSVLAGAASIAEAAIAVSTNSTIAAAMDGQGTHADVSDGDLEFTVNSIFSALAGVAAEAV